MTKQKNKVIWKELYEPIYRTTVLFITNASREEANKVLRRIGIKPLPESFDLCKGVTVAFDQEGYPKLIKGVIFLVWVSDKKDFYNLLHETTHLVIKIFEWRYQEITDQSSEAFAYYVQYWFKTLGRIMDSTSSKG